MNNDNLYFVCQTFFFLRVLLICSVQSQMMLTFFFQVSPPARKKLDNHEALIVIKSL